MQPGIRTVQQYDEVIEQLQAAVTAGDEASVRQVLQRGGCMASSAVRIQRIRTSGKTVLHVAAANGNPAVVRALLDARADVNAVDMSGDTPLSAALQHAASEAVNCAGVVRAAEVLLQAGAAVTASELAAAANLLAHQQQQLQPAAVVQQVDHLWRTMLAAAGSVDVQDSKGRTALHVAVSQMPEAVEVLLAAGASVSATCSRGDTMLHAAASSRSWVAKHCPERQLQILQRIIAAPGAAACLNAVDASGFTLMALAVCDGGDSCPAARDGSVSCLDRVRLLLAAGADINAAGPEGSTPLTQAAWACRDMGRVGVCDAHGLEVSAALLSAGANPNPPESNCLRGALVFGHCEVVQALIQAGACSNAAQAKQALGDVRNGFVSGLGSALGLARTLQLLLTADYPKYCKPTLLDVVECCTLCLSNQSSHPCGCSASAVPDAAYGSAAAAGVLSALREAMIIVDDPTALRVALLRGWAAATAEGDADRAATAAIEQRAAATRSGFRELLLGVALEKKDCEQQDNSTQQPAG